MTWEFELQPVNQELLVPIRLGIPGEHQLTAVRLSAGARPPHAVLHHPVAGGPAILHDAPIPVLFAVLEPLFLARRNMAHSVRRATAAGRRAKSALQGKMTVRRAATVRDDSKLPHRNKAKFEEFSGE
ncbi:hypothetical protein [Aquisalimonas sp.]|uniref:hypothetical protein n=1 Tax=Aquisalimonas sp. TaxID=1872621 RepID=UPI0025C01DE5|nr:hypothetical protein [Aquisalimonas sp.]